MIHFTIRKASVEDAEQLLGIYRPYVEDTAITFEYVTPTLEEFGNRIQDTLRMYPYLVAEKDDGQIIGYAYASSFKTRAAYDWSVETSIYVDQHFHGEGVGTTLYNELETILRKQHIINVNACIAYAHEGNDHLDNGSMLFHEKLGYKLVGTFHNCAYKFSQWYDMIWMEKMIGEHLSPIEPVIPYPNL